MSDALRMAKKVSMSEAIFRRDAEIHECDFLFLQFPSSPSTNLVFKYRFWYFLCSVNAISWAVQ